MILRLVVAGAILTLAVPAAAAAPPECEVLAQEKRLVGKSKASFLRKCAADLTVGDPLARCERAADRQSLRGAARNGQVQRCLSDGPTPG